jgi:hypothetical protein
MNIVADTETPMKVIAKVCGCKERNNSKKVIYSFLDSYHSLCIDERCYTSRIRGCERLLKYAADENDKNVVEREVAELKMMLEI